MSDANLEIERKFLVSDREAITGSPSTAIAQGYLAREGQVAVRVRLRDGRGTLTVKARRAAGEAFEWERPLEVADAEALLEGACSTAVIRKRRHLIPVGDHTWEVDVFEGANAGLIVAEVELSRSDETVVQPAWLGPEVTEDERFLNARLVDRPFETWGVSYDRLLADPRAGR